MRIAMPAAAAVLGAVLAAPATAKEINKHFHETFDVKEGVTLRLDHGDGDVHLTTWDRDAIDVEIVYRASFTKVGVGTGPDFEAGFQQEGDVVHVVGRETGVQMVGIFLSLNVSEYAFTVRIPPYASLRSRGADGDVEITGLRASVECRLDDGDLTMEDVRAPVVRLDLEDGEIRLREHPSGPLEVEAEDGDVRIDLRPGEEADLDVTVSDGDVRLTLADGVSAAFLISTDDGKIRLDAPGARRLERGRDRAYGEIGDASGEIRIRTDDGDVTFEAERGGA